ncbi:uncharacterized protein LOC135688614 [Rhopilema esculentum]|uniref:uncharacterized protein LOC135688614 n=1 Tax=Rhopilema esculentum TaxID=499914 RepID=UPI0031D71447
MELDLKVALGLFSLFLICNTAEESSKGKRQPLKLSKTFEDGNSSVHVYDAVFGKRLLAVSANLVKKYATWYFTYPDPYRMKRDQEENDGDLHWNAPISPERFSNSLIWKSLKERLKGTGMLNTEEFFPYDVKATMLLRGFSPAVYQGKGEGDIFIRIFLSKAQKKNDYSELMIYNKKEEVIASIFPKYGRVVLWNDNTDFVFKPPSMNVEQAEYSLLIKTTRNETKFTKSMEKFKVFESKQMEMRSQPFPYLNASHEDIYKIDLSKHLTGNFTDSTGRIVAVFDNVISKDEVDTIRDYFLSSNTAYLYDSYDNKYDEDNDNVNWIVKKDPLSIISSRVWKYVHHCVSFLSGENQWYPYDVAMNIIQHTHHTRIHEDCAQHEHEYTFLMYLSPEWSDERYGETIFVERVKEKEKLKTGNEKYETLGAVVPKYGRFVVFRNIIEHSARPPSPDFLGARYTFALKVGRSPAIAIAKSLREVLEAHNDNPKAMKLQEDIYAGKYDVYNDEKIEAFLRKTLTKYKQLNSDMTEKDRDNVFKMLKL